MKKLVRITTIPLSLEKLLEDQGSFFKAHYKITFVAADAQKLEAVAAQQGADHFPLEMTRKITPLQDLRCLIKLYHFLRKEKPLIVHTHTPKAGIIGMLAARLAGVPIRLHTIAGLPLMEARGLKRSLLLALEKLTYYCATKVYPNSKGLLSFVLEKRLAPKEKLNIIGKGSSNGIDTRYFSKKQVTQSQVKRLRATYDLTTNDFIYCFVGRLVGDKGINELVNAFCEVNKAISSTKLLLVGPYESALDPLRNQTQKIINTHPNIITTGFQADIRPYLAFSNVFVFPSYREGFPNVVLQAAAMEVPCIVSNINGCNEIIQEGVNGALVPPKQVQPLIEKMILFFEQQTTLHTFTRQARLEVETHFERKQFWDYLLKEYKDQEQYVSSH